MFANKSGSFIYDLTLQINLNWIKGSIIYQRFSSRDNEIRGRKKLLYDYPFGIIIKWILGLKLFGSYFSFYYIVQRNKTNS